MARNTLRVILALATFAALAGVPTQASAFDWRDTCWWCRLYPWISFSANRTVIFQNESAQLSWSIGNSNCAEMSTRWFRQALVIDTRQPSGTRYSYGSAGSGDPLACSLPFSGTSTVSAGVLGPRVETATIRAHSASGFSTAASESVDVLPLPRFSGCSSSRTSRIKAGLKQVTEALRDRCIRGDASLDTSVAAFRDGRLRRSSVDARLLAELQNLNLITFRCEDTTDDRAGGFWRSYGNEITLRWGPRYEPNFSYVILHELIHKSGFHDGLRSFYSGNSIEYQTHQVTQACF